MSKLVSKSRSFVRVQKISTIALMCLFQQSCSADSSHGNSHNNAEAINQTEFIARPLVSKINGVQPMTGIVFWHNNQSALNALDDIVQLEFSYLLYSNFVNQNKEYDWSSLDDLLSQIASRGHQAVLRFRFTYPGETVVSVPDFIETAPEYESRIASVEGQPTYLPDWGFKGLEDFTLGFYSAFAERYDDDPRIAILQVGFGSYAEYHLYEGPFGLGETFPSKAFQTEFLEHLDEAFDDLHWAVSKDAASNRYTPISNDPVLQELKYGIFDDSFMHESHSQDDFEYNRASWLFLVKTAFMKVQWGASLVTTLNTTNKMC